MLNIELEKPLVFLDLEATGLNVVRDRIVQIGMIRYFPGREEPEQMEMIINPGIPISEEAYRVHGIGPKEVANKPTFQQVAQKIYDFIGDADLAGYNSDRYDIPMLIEEFYRAGINFELDTRRTLDMQKIFYKMEPRTLSAAVRYYCGEILEGAHDALEDVRATVKVLNGQLAKYKDQPHYNADNEVVENPVVPDVVKLSELTTDKSMVDVTQRLRINDQGVVVFNFGKYIGQPVAQTLSSDKQYYQWMLNKEFSVQVKKTIKKLVEAYEKTKTSA